MAEIKDLTLEESLKESSSLLRGHLLEDLADAAPNLPGRSEHLLKFHGIYAQDHRDVRRERAQAGAVLDYIFMIRVAIPGGRLTSEQWLCLDEIASELADGSIRLTTRQAVQFHGVVKHSLQTLSAQLYQKTMTSFAGCGDVVRNTVMCPQLETDPNYRPIVSLAQNIATTYQPKTKAHWEIFVNGDKAATFATTADTDVEHEFYGDTYLPRKFKIAIAHPNENCVDVLAQDVGLIPATHPEVGAGFNVYVAGGLGRSYAQPDTFARLADPLTFVTREELDPLLRAILTAYRDLGDRTNRRRARMKYIAADLGLATFVREVESRLGSTLRAPLPLTLGAAHDHLGWRTRPDGLLELGVRVGAGRVRDEAEGRGIRSALRTIAAARSINFIVTAQQDIVLTGITPQDKGFIDDTLAAHGVRSVDALGLVERSALACPALPTCGQALAESERVLPNVVAQLEESLESAGPKGKRLQLRMTGCPNGCARPAVAEVGIVGRTKNSYDLYLGGGLRGDRLAGLYQEKVKLDDLPSVLEPLLARWRDEGDGEESFGDFVTRVGIA